jgi:hypothetical protein
MLLMVCCVYESNKNNLDRFLLLPFMQSNVLHSDTISEHQFAYEGTYTFFRKTLQFAEFSNVFVTDRVINF